MKAHSAQYHHTCYNAYNDREYKNAKLKIETNRKKEESNQISSCEVSMSGQSKPLRELGSCMELAAFTVAFVVMKMLKRIYMRQERIMHQAEKLMLLM